MESRRRFDSPDTCELSVPLKFGISPDGRPLNSVEELPDLPLPKKVVVTEGFLCVDGWILRVWPIGRATLKWVSRQAGRWCQNDQSPENQAQVMGVIDPVPRGAGYCQLLQKQGLRKLLEEALKLLDCSCTHSCRACLKGYENQQQWDILRREPVLERIQHHF